MMLSISFAYNQTVFAGENSERGGVLLKKAGLIKVGFNASWEIMLLLLKMTRSEKKKIDLFMAVDLMRKYIINFQESQTNIGKNQMKNPR